MKITLVTETFPPEVNGVAMTLSRLVGGLTKLGHQLQIVRPRQGPADRPAPQAEPKQITVGSMPIPGYSELRMGFPVYWTFKKLWKQAPPDIVHIATEGPLGWSALLAARSLKLTVVTSFHTNFHTYSQHYGFGFLQDLTLAFLRSFHNRALITFAPTKQICSELSEQGLNDLKVLGRGVDTTLFNPNRRDAALRQSWSTDSETQIVAYVGRIAAEKNIELAVEAFHAMQKVRTNLKFVLVGDGPMRAKLEADNPDFIFAGFQKGADLARHYASADIFLFPSMSETFGNVLTEAMASGLAVLTFNYAAGREYIVHGENGLLAPFNDAETFKTHATQLVDASTDCAALGKNAAHTTQALTWEAVINQYVSDIEAIRRARF